MYAMIYPITSLYIKVTHYSLLVLKKPENALVGLIDRGLPDRKYFLLGFGFRKN